MAKVLVVDDESAICSAFEHIVQRAGHQCQIASNGHDALTMVEQAPPDVVFLDVRLPDLNGLEVLDQLRQLQPLLPVIIMTAHGTVDTAIQAVRNGAFDYLGKPLELEQIRTLLERALSKTQAEHSHAETPAENPDVTPRLIGSSAIMQEIFKMIGLLASNDLTVLISGETGVGKEMVARAIHSNSQRNAAPFVAINCAAIPETLIESELFGHEKGAFTGAHGQRIGRFEAAGNGTLFLDEVFELPQHLQSKLLRVLQERQYERVGSVTPLSLDARIIAATNRSPQSIGTDVREDLYHRLSLINLNVPALRERRDDIEALARHFLGQANAELQKHLQDFEADALKQLESHLWPGNVRELENTVKRSALTAHGAIITSADLQFDATSIKSARHHEDMLDAACLRAMADFLAGPDAQDPEASVFHTLIGRMERTIVQEALRLTDGNQVAAAQMLGINRTTLRNKAD